MAARTYAPEISWDSEVRQYLEAALGPQKLAEISAALARPPLATCLRVNTLRTSPQVPCRARRRPLRRRAAAANPLTSTCRGNSQLALRHLRQAAHTYLPTTKPPLPATAAHPPLPGCLAPSRLPPQDLLRRLPEALAPEDRALLETNPAYVHPLLPDAVILPGTGPHAVDYSRTRECVCVAVWSCVCVCVF